MRKDIEVIREYCPLNKRCVVRTNSYGHSLGFLNTLFEEVQKDFPDLKADEVSVKLYSGRSFRGTFSLEFRVKEKPPETYREISEFELTF
jgi:hypothetical protein